jgi:MFS family permease
MIAITRACTAFSPRPPLILAGVATNPHALQWSVVGFGFYVVVNLVQSLKLSDPVAHAVMTGSPTLLLCMGVGSLQSMINYGIMGFTPAFLMKTYALTPTQTGVQFGLLSAALGVIGPLIAGPLSDRLNQRLPGAGRIWVTLISLTLSPLIAVWVYTAPDAGAFYLRFTLYSFILTMWLAPLYAVMFEQVLPRMRAITTAAYLMAMTITGLGIGPYFVGMVSDATGDLSRAILSINVLAPLIVVLLVALLSRAARDTQNLLHRAPRRRRGGLGGKRQAASPTASASAQFPCRPKRIRMGMLIVAIGPFSMSSASNSNRSLNDAPPAGCRSARSSHRLRPRPWRAG